MAKERGNIESCLRLTVHHVDPSKVLLMLIGGALTQEGVEYRFKLVRENLAPVIEKIREIRTAAERGDSQAVLALLDAEVEFGHDFNFGQKV